MNFCTDVAQHYDMEMVFIINTSSGYFQIKYFDIENVITFFEHHKIQMFACILCMIVFSATEIVLLSQLVGQLHSSVCSTPISL